MLSENLGFWKFMTIMMQLILCCSDMNFRVNFKFSFSCSGPLESFEPGVSIKKISAFFSSFIKVNKLICVVTDSIELFDSKISDLENNLQNKLLPHPVSPKAIIETLV